MTRFTSLQAKLILAFLALMAAVLLASGTAFVWLTREDVEQSELDKTAAIAPVISAEFFLREARGDSLEIVAAAARDAAKQYGARIIITDAGMKVIVDSDGELVGKTINAGSLAAVPTERPPGPAPHLPAYSLVYPGPGPAGDLVLVRPSLMGLRARMGGGDSALAGAARTGRADYALYLAIPRETITNAWLSMLPALGLAALVALPIAVLLAVIVARYITRPIQQLTVATHRMAEGTFDVEIAVKRRDEVGQLAGAFTSMAERVGKAQMEMRTLVGNVSHDLKTPLTSILGFAQALRAGGAASPAEARRMGEVIHDEASRLATRLDELLYLSELESGQAVVESEEIDVGHLLGVVIGRVRPALETRGVPVSIDTAPGLTATADGAKLERALENLLENARRYTPDGGTVRVSGRREASQPPAVVVEVANTAAGITGEEVPRLFERFYRRDRSRSGAKGSGLGLPIARDLIELQGGTLEAALEGDEIVFRARIPAAG